VVLEYEHHDQAARFQVGRWKREEACRKLRLVDWFLPSMNRSNPSAGCEHPGVRHQRYHHRQPAFEPPGHERRSTFSEMEAAS
jgi:hypothetical protein